MSVWYTTREAVKASLDIKETARNNALVDSAIEAASRAIDGGPRIGGLLRRRFYPEIATRYFDWPDTQYSTSWRLWLNQHELLSVSSLVSGGVTISSPNYLLRPEEGPPYDRVEILLSGTGSFQSGSTHQKSIAISGTFGFTNETTPAGTLAEALDNSETGVDVSNSGIIGVGDLIKVDSEYMRVTGKTMLDTTQNLQTPLTAQNSAVTVAVSDGTAFNVDEVILLDSERMLIVDIAGNNLTVRRAWDGSTLAAHTASDIYAPRTLTVERGVLGTTAATHSTSAAISKHVVPGLVKELCEAYALNTLLQKNSGYARVAGEGDSAREFTGRGIRAIENDAVRAYRRDKVRTEAV